MLFSLPDWLGGGHNRACRSLCTYRMGSILLYDADHSAVCCSLRPMGLTQASFLSQATLARRYDVGEVR